VTLSQLGCSQCSQSLASWRILRSAEYKEATPASRDKALAGIGHSRHSTGLSTSINPITRWGVAMQLHEAGPVASINSAYAENQAREDTLFKRYFL